MRRFISTIAAVLFFSFSFGQTLPAPTINCVTTNALNGDVTINWTAPPVDSCGSFIGYVIYTSTDSLGPYFVLDTVTDPLQTTYLHTGANGTILDWFYFMVSLQDCPGYTSDSSSIQQEVPLITPSVDYVTVVPGGVEVRWLPSPNSQAIGYIVYWDRGGPLADIIDTVFGRLNTFYFDTEEDPDTGSIAYTVAALDGCGNRALTDPDEHRTIFLSANIISCEQEVELNWNPYINWPSGVDEYQLEVALDNNPLTVEETFPGNIATGQFNYSISGLIGDTICFRINAVRNGDGQISQSNVVCLPLNFIQSTTFNNLRRVSVNTGGGVDIDWYVDSSAAINTYFVQRGTDSFNLATIDTIPVTNPAFFNQYPDPTAQIDQTSYYYSVVTKDDCDFELESTVGRTIYLQGSNQSGINALSWNPFELKYATVQSYTINRLENGTLVPLETVMPSVLSYEDIVEFAISEEGQFCYAIETNYLLEIPGLSSESLTSMSNTLCLDVPSPIFVPNAFNPNSEISENQRFKPTLRNPNAVEYEFHIFDRWGKEIFYTDLVNVGWDGSNNGEDMPLGGYTYYIRAKYSSGQIQEAKGIVILIR